MRHGKYYYGKCKPYWKYKEGYQSPYTKYKQDITFNEESNQYEFRLEVPGFSRDQVKIKASKEFLFVEIDDQKKEDEKPTNLRYTFRQEVDIGNIKAKFNNGLVTVKIPLKETEKYDINIEEVKNLPKFISERVSSLVQLLIVLYILLYLAFI